MSESTSGREVIKIGGGFMGTHLLSSYETFKAYLAAFYQK